MSDLSEKIRELSDLLAARTIRYSRDHGEPNPSKAFPVEVVFSMKEWEQISAVLLDLETSSREVVLGLVAATVVEIRLEEAKHWSSFYPHQHGTSAIDCANCSACTRTKTLENEAAAERQMKRGSGK